MTMRLHRCFYTIPLRLRSLFRRRQVERDLDEEIRYHLDRQIQQYLDSGFTPEEARLAAMRHFGGIEHRKEECRDVRRVSFIENVLRDFSFGLRTLRQNAGFAFAAAATL